MTNTAFFSQIIVDTTNYSVTYSGASYTLTVGVYYAYSPTNADSFIHMLQTRLASILGTTCAVSFSASTGLFQIVLGASRTFQFALQQDFGFSSGNLSGTTITATLPCKFCWFPFRAVADLDTHYASQGITESQNSQKVTNNGDVYTQFFGSNVQQRFSFRYLNVAQVFGAGNTAEYFNANTLQKGLPFLAILDYSVNSYFYEYVAKLSDVNKFAVRREGNTLIYWSWTFTAYGI